MPAKAKLLQKDAARRTRYAEPPPPAVVFTPEFKGWFGNSKVVGPSGLPLVVHHGSPDLRFLKENGIYLQHSERYGKPAPEIPKGFFFVDDFATAKTYADPHRAFDYQNSEPGVASFFLKIENPLIMDNKGERWKHQTVNAVETAVKGGHDGIIVKNTIDTYHPQDGKKAANVYVVFNSNQIKSVKNTTFNPAEKSVYATAKPTDFKTWFDGSAIVNSDGTPKMVYHGSQTGIGDYGRTIHFTDSPQLAARYAKGESGPGTVYAAYLRIKKPADLREPGASERIYQETDEWLDQDELLNPETLAQKDLSLAGYDGIIANHEIGGGSLDGTTEYVVFNSSQVWIVPDKKKTAAMHYYHGSTHGRLTGKTLRPMPNEDGTPDAPRPHSAEAVLEHYRPPNMLKRSQVIYMVDRPSPDLITFCGGEDEYIYEVVPAGKVERGAFEYITDIEGIIWENPEYDINDPKLRELAEAYWSGEEHPEQHVFEYRAPSATVLMRVPNRKLASPLYVGTPQFKNWFRDSKVVNPDGTPARVFRGDNRGDKLEPSFKPSRATSGRFYFTENPEVASSYSTSKPYVPENEEDYYFWYKFPAFKRGRERISPNLNNIWYYLSPEQKERFKHVAMTTNTGDDGGIEFESENGPVNNDLADEKMVQRQFHGDWIKAAAESWLRGGTLYDQEEEFSKLLDKAGIPYEYDNPYEARPMVTAVYLSIQNPLDTSNIPQRVVDKFHEMAKGGRRKVKMTDPQWDKANYSVRDWVDKLDDDLQHGTTHAWTVMPEKITQALQQMGYDGIKDTGGKLGGEEHGVWIAFEPNQIKSAIANKNFNPNKNKITAKLAYLKKAKLKAASLEDIESLKDYLTMTDDEKGEELARTFMNHFVEWLEGKAESGEFTVPEPAEEFWAKFEDYDDDVWGVIPRPLFEEYLADEGGYFLANDPAECPSFMHMSFESEGNGWLIHKTDYADQIAWKGFTTGVSEISRLGLTTWFTNEGHSKKYGGYNFAFQADSGREAARAKYGKDAVLFRAPYILVHHYGDEEDQAIFWGADAKDIITIKDGYDGWSLGIEEDEQQADLNYEIAQKETEITNAKMELRSPRAYTRYLKYEGEEAVASSATPRPGYVEEKVTAAQARQEAQEELEELTKELAELKSKVNTDLPPSGDLQEVVDWAISHYEQIKSMFSTPQRKAASKTAADKMIIYRGTSQQSKADGPFWTPSRNFAMQFTQSGQDNEVLQATIDADKTWRPLPELPYGGDVDEIKEHIPEAKKHKCKAIWCSEGQGQPDSIYVFDRTLLTQQKTYETPKKKAPAKAKKPKLVGQPATEPFKKWFGDSKAVDAKGKPLVVYHGTTHDFEEFDNKENGNVENHYGNVGFYFTSSKHDASKNYAGEGPDLTNRIEQLAEKLYDQNEAADMDEAKEKAKAELKGSHEGAVLPVYLSLQNPVIVEPGKYKGTIFQTEFEESEEDEDGNRDIIGETGNGVELITAIQDILPYDDKTNELIGDLQERLLDGISAYEFEKIARSSHAMEAFVYDEEEGGSSGNVIAQIYESMGFDGIIQKDVSQEFTGMGLVKGTTHYVAFNANQIKSAIGNRGTFDPSSNKITASYVNDYAIYVKHANFLPKKYHYITDCVNSDQDSIHDMQDQARSVTYSTMARNCAEFQTIIRSLGYHHNFPITQDWSVGYYRSRYRGVPCFYLEHSHIEYIFTLNGLNPEPVHNDDNDFVDEQVEPLPMTASFEKEAFRPTPEKLERMLKPYGLTPEQVEQVVATDPSPDLNYVTWIGKQVQQNKIRLPEDEGKIKGQLERFTKLKRSPKFTGDKDIQKYDPASLYRAVTEKADAVSKKEEVRELKTQGRPGAKVLFNKDGLVCYEVTDVAALMELSSNTNWCTTQEKYAAQYLEEGPIYTIYYNGKPYAQYSPDSDQFMNPEDNEIRESLSDAVMDMLGIEAPEDPFGHLQSAKSYAYGVMDTKLAEVIFALPNVFKDIYVYKPRKTPDTPNACVYYAKNFLKGPYPEGEPIIAKSPIDAFEYAVDVLHGPFPAGEPAIASVDDMLCYKYATRAIKGRFPLGEPKIMKSDLAGIYAINVLKHRWPEAEPYMFAISDHATANYTRVSDAAKYVFHFTQPGERWPAFEKLLLAGGFGSFDYEYCRFCLRDRWPEVEFNIYFSDETHKYAREFLPGGVWPEDLAEKFKAQKAGNIQKSREKMRQDDMKKKSKLLTPNFVMV